MPHPGTWRDAATVNRAYELNAPPVAWLSDKEPAYTGVLLGLEASNLVIDTIKKAEKEDAIVIRIYESWGVDVEAKLDTAFKIAKATECDLLERDLQTLEHGESSLLLSFKPFEIKTVKLVPCKS